MILLVQQNLLYRIFFYVFLIPLTVPRYCAVIALTDFERKLTSATVLNFINVFSIDSSVYSKLKTSKTK